MSTILLIGEFLEGRKMSRKYKFNDKNGVYFISFATVYWIDVFIRDCYFETMMSALNYCRENKGMKIYGYCIMPSHVHLLFQIEEKNPSDVIRDLKTFTAKALLKQIAEHPQESHKNGCYGCSGERRKSIVM